MGSSQVRWTVVCEVVHVLSFTNIEHFSEDSLCLPVSLFPSTLNLSCQTKTTAGWLSGFICCSKVFLKRGGKPAIHDAGMCRIWPSGYPAFCLHHSTSIKTDSVEKGQMKCWCLQFIVNACVGSFFWGSPKVWKMCCFFIKKIKINQLRIEMLKF